MQWCLKVSAPVVWVCQVLSQPLVRSLPATHPTPSLTLPLQSDACRGMQLRCHTAREGHLFRKFGWGNRKSLVEDPAAAGLDVREALLAYYRCDAVRAVLCCAVPCCAVLPLCQHTLCHPVTVAARTTAAAAHTLSMCCPSL